MASAEQTQQAYAGAEEPHSGQDRKRRRLATVCLPCRTRKLKCDKEFPFCTRCQKSGKPEQCVYDEAAVREMRQPGVESSAPVETGSNGSIILLPDDPTKGRHIFHRPRSAYIHGNDQGPSQPQGLEDRIQLLERLVLQQAQSHTPLQQNPVQHMITTRLPDPTLIISTLVNSFEGFKPLITELRFNTPLLGRILRELHSIKRMKPAIMLNPGTIVDHRFLDNLMPPKEIVDSLVEIYLACVEPVYRLTYVPTFKKVLQQYWGSADGVPTELIVQLLLMMATVWHQKYSDIPLSTLRREATKQDPLACSHDSLNHLKAGYWILCCEEWIRQNKLTHIDLDSLRLQAHVIIAKDANRIRHKHEWTSIGTLVKMAMARSLHRDSDEGLGSAPYVRIRQRASKTVHAREMRRRIWASIVELDLKASFDKGMPPTVQERDFDSPGPANLNDEDFDETSETSQEPHPSTIPTDTSLQHELFKSLGLRLRTCALIYSPRLVTSYVEVAEMDNELTRALEVIPDWEEHVWKSPCAEFIKRARLWRGVLKYKIRHCMLSLHNRLTLMGGQHSLLPTSQQMRIDIAADILLHHITTNECFRRLNVLAPLDCYGQAALTICHHLYTNETGFASLIGRQLVPELSESLLNMAEKLLSELECKATLTGKGHKEFLLISVVIALTRMKLNPRERDTIRQKLVERLVILGYRMLGRMGGDEEPNQAPNFPADEQQQQQEQQPPTSSPHIAVVVPTPETLANEYADFDPSFIPTTDTTPSDWSWDFLPGEWASTGFFNF